MSVIAYRITSLAIVGVMLLLGLTTNGVAQTVDTVSAVHIETMTVTVYRVREPVKVPIAVDPRNLGIVTDAGLHGGASPIGGTVA
jgi:hypothetical protein